MLLPENTDIISFIDRYFIRAGYTSKVLDNEDVRIVYSDVAGSDTDVPNVRRNMMVFDIYVKTEHQHNADKDRLKFRTQLIATRLDQQLRQSRYLNSDDGGGYRFWPAGDWDAGTKTIGYARYTIAFNYMKVY